MCEKLDDKQFVNPAVDPHDDDDVIKIAQPCSEEDKEVRASATQTTTEGLSTRTTESVPQKKRKTRRGKCKRRNAHPYVKNFRKNGKLLKKPEAPHNSNQFLLEDHGNIRLDEELDQKLKNTSRNRDSSFSIDNDSEIEDEFYSSPDDEQEYLIKEFHDQYETEHAERLYAMSKNELIQEYIQLESKVESLTKRLQSVENSDGCVDLRTEIHRLTMENTVLKQENIELKGKLSVSYTSDSDDSETDSSESCSSSSSSSMSGRPGSPVGVDYTQTNGFSPPLSIS